MASDAISPVRLAELEPVLSATLLRFRCPVHGHWLIIPVRGEESPIWRLTGTLPDISVVPSIDSSCGFHGTITNGEVSYVVSAPRR